MTKEKLDMVTLEYGEIGLIIEAIKKQRDRVEHERFYRHDNSDEFYDVYLRRYDQLLNKLSLATKIVKVPKEMWFKG